MKNSINILFLTLTYTACYGMQPHYPNKPALSPQYYPQTAHGQVDPGYLTIDPQSTQIRQIPEQSLHHQRPTDINEAARGFLSMMHSQLEDMTKEPGLKAEYKETAQRILSLLSAYKTVQSPNSGRYTPDSPTTSRR